MAEPVQAIARAIETGELITLRGSARIEGARTFKIEGTPKIFVPQDFILVGAPDPPDAIFTAEFVGLSSQIVESASEQLDVDLFSFAFPGGPGSLVEDYDPTHWDKAIVTNPGDATLTGANGDQLTAGTALGTLVVDFTYNVAGSPAEGTVARGTTEVVAATVLNVLEIYNVPGNVVEGQSYTLLVRELDGVTGEVIEDPATSVVLNVDSGPANITGGNTLNIDAASAPASVQVSASKTGVTGDSATFTVIVAPAFPDNEPGGFTQLVSLDGSTKDWPALPVIAGPWNDDSRTAVISAPSSKFGNAIEKRYFVGDGPGWYGFRSAANWQGGWWRELYMRMVFEVSGNWQWHSAGGKFWYYRTAEGSHGDYVVMWNGDGGLRLVTKGVVGITSDGEWLANDMPAVSRGVYHTLEVHHGASTAGANGFYRVWLDNVMVPSWRHIDDGSITDVVFEGVEWSVTVGDTNKGVGGMQAPMFWGGTGGAKSVNDQFRLSELYVSGLDKQ